MKEFDPESYWQSYTDLLELRARGWWSNEDLAGHYRDFGSREGRVSPSPGEVPADWSDWLYFSEWRDEFEWWWRKGVLETGAYSALAARNHALAFGRISQNARVQDLTGLPPAALEQVATHARAWPGSGPLGSLGNEPLAWAGAETGLTLPLLDWIARTIPGPVDYLLLLPSLQVGGAELVGTWHARMAAGAGLRTAILLADRADISPAHAALAPLVINLPDLARSEAGLDWQGLPLELRIRVMTAAVESLRPGTLHLIHSWIGYTALSTAATARTLRATCRRIHVSAFCHHIHAQGHYDGYFRYIPAICPLVDRFVFDNDWYLRDIRDRYALPDEKVAALRYPAPPAEPVPQSRTAGSSTVLWASRLDHQKNPQVVARVALECPELEFVMFGTEILSDTRIDWSAMPRNLRYGGPFSVLEDLPLDQVFAFLYTARFDGTPNVLIEMGSRGIPVVAPRICGIPDFLGPDWPHYVEGTDDVAGYARHLKALYADLSLRADASARLLAIVREERSFERFARMGLALLMD